MITGVFLLPFIYPVSSIEIPPECKDRNVNPSAYL